MRSIIAAKSWEPGNSREDNELRRDEEKFMDRSKLTCFMVDERISK